MGQPNIACGYLRGTGSAINVSIGFVPDFVMISNLTDGDKIHQTYPMGGRGVIVFTSGGTTTNVTAGKTLKGETSGATAKIVDVILDTGSWAGGDAAGWIIIDKATLVGTFTTESMYYVGSSGTDDLSGVVEVYFGQDIDTEVAAVTGNAGVLPYFGSTTAARGFTVGSTISEDADLLAYVAIRNGSGALDTCPNSA